MIHHPTTCCPKETAHRHVDAADWSRRSLITPTDMEPVIEEVLCLLEATGFSYREIFAVRLALEEAIMNAIRHGHGFDRNKQVRVRYHVTPECLLAEIEDEGDGFDPCTVADPCEETNLERECGRGLMLMRSYMTWVRYNERGTCVTLCKCHSA